MKILHGGSLHFDWSGGVCDQSIDTPMTSSAAEKEMSAVTM